ncbi:TraC family protein [Poseidonibacter ostreae]|uniref:TraC family protein n=1 Tax=Poseidonibacter ostreae TaxID=2654171 RepID=A0A6L4WNJ2_9BACT|nr:TraC family protein [Poseidonibacter ostreae]KAB7884671.1 TraC family protein [Poseidonibacter ostreae]KAB7885182.1 TraC family protein [Poseidonibacter ostreae]KAB7889592.1 TraC family protein [Poseidonibacter ostreae]
MSLFEKYFQAHIGPINSIPTNSWKNLFENNKISDFIPYTSYDDSTELFHNNDDSVSFAIELLSPHTRSGNDTAGTMIEIFEKMPEHAYLSVMYYGSKNIKHLLSSYRNSHKERGKESVDGKEVDDSIDMICDFILKKTEEPCSTQMQTSIKDIRVVFSVVFPINKDPQEIKKFKSDMFNILNANKMNPKTLDKHDILELSFELMNPQVPIDNYPFYDDKKFLNQQVVSKNTKFVVDDDYININDTKCWVNSTLQSISDKAHIFEFGLKLGDYLSDSLNSNQFNDSFLINATIKRKPKKSASKTVKTHSFINTQDWGPIFRKFEAKKKESLEIIDRIQEKKETLFEYDLDVLVSGKDFKETLLNQQTIESYWKKTNDGLTKLKLEKTKGIHHLAFLSALPMAMNNEYFYNIGGKFRTLFSSQAAHLFPLEADSKGDGHNLLLTTRRGVLAGVDLYSSSTNFNAFLVATSGAGKSVLLNMLAYNSYARGDKVFVLDYDNSFTGLVENLDGQYLDLDPTFNAISFNPYTDIKNEDELNDELPYLSSFIYLLGSSKSLRRAEEDEKLITNTLQQVIKEQFAQFGNELEITNIRDAIFKDYGQDDRRFSDFSRQLDIYCQGGIYEKWFSGRCQFSMDKDMMAVEFKGVENHPELRDPLVMLLLYHIGKVMYSTDTNKPRIQIIFDEAHRFLGKNPRMDDFIEQAYRRARKFNGSIILATQGFSDIYDSDGGLSRAGKTIIDNSAWKFFMNQQETSTNLLLNSGIFSFNEIDKKIIRKIRTQKREYSEIFCINSSNVKMSLRLLMPTFFYYLTTTDGADKKLINSYMTNNNLTKIEAIKKIIEDQENG